MTKPKNDKEGKIYPYVYYMVESKLNDSLHQENFEISKDAYFSKFLVEKANIEYKKKKGDYNAYLKQSVKDLNDEIGERILIAFIAYRIEKKGKDKSRWLILSDLYIAEGCSGFYLVKTDQEESDSELRKMPRFNFNHIEKLLVWFGFKTAEIKHNEKGDIIKCRTEVLKLDLANDP